MKVKQLIKSINDVFDNQPWYGDSILSKLKVLNDSDIHILIEGSTHTIADLLVHMINWRVFAIEKISGNANYSISLNSNQDWSNKSETKKQTVAQLIYAFESTRDSLISILETKDDDFLDQKNKGDQYDYRSIIEGTIQHDIYHLGQVGLLSGMIDKNRKQEE